MKNKPRLSEYELTYPKFYHVDDMNWMFEQLDRLDLEHRKNISFKYEMCFMRKGRPKANGLLKTYADKYGKSQPEQRSKVLSEHPNPFKDRVNKIRQRHAREANKKTILGMMDSDSN